jgi:hypothetical protein
VSILRKLVLRPCMSSEEELGLFKKFGAGPLSSVSVSRDRTRRRILSVQTEPLSPSQLLKGD